ncbi:MAG: DUF4258 domain-containing protein [Candidatus Sericytochromatia bacterium]
MKITTNHCKERMSKRNISSNSIDICLKYGKKVYKSGVIFYILLEKIIKKHFLSEKLSGLCVLVDKNDNIIITT